MDGLCTWLTQHHLPFESSDGNHFYQTSDILEEQSGHRINSQTRTGDDFETWLANPALSSKKDIQLRMLWLPIVGNTQSSTPDQILYPWRIEARKNDLDRALHAFRVSLAYSYSFSAPQGYAVLQEGSRPNATTRPITPRPISYCIFRRNNFLINWSPTDRGDWRQTLVVSHPPAISALKEVVNHQKYLSAHPLFPALIVATWQGNDVGRFLITLTNEITQVENRTGYHPWSIAIYGTADGDFTSLSAKMSGVSTNLAELTAKIKFLRGLLKWIGELQPKLAGADVDFTACIEMIGQRLDQQEIHLGFLKDRANNQLTVLFNLITSQDARTGIEVARDSKTLAVASKLDSSSMKTLAAVSVIFLPGTFVASFFAMPMFDIQHDSMAVSDKFWIYWIITVPLTVITVVVWYLWIRRKRILMEEAERPRRDDRGCNDGDEELGLKSD